MKYLLDTGILLRLVHPTDPQHQDVIDALAVLKNAGHTFYCGMQNAAEFWNATTRPVTARGGFGLTPHEAEMRLTTIERAVEVLTESAASYTEWTRLEVLHSVSGVQVHDTRLVALMLIQRIANLLTFNAADFNRFAAIRVVTPKEILNANAGTP
jgi:predicted nucleic acid-binding protein